jgi:hypothetical protein
MRDTQYRHVEAAHIAFLLERDGDAETLVWVKH